MSTLTTLTPDLDWLDFAAACVNPHEQVTPASVAVTCKAGCWTQLYCPGHFEQFRRHVNAAIAQRGHIGCATCNHTASCIEQLATVTPL